MSPDDHVPDPPAWLTAKVDQRLAMMEQGLKGVDMAATFLITPLTEPREGATKLELARWERICDCCGVYQPSGIYSGWVVRSLSNGHPVHIFFGVCEAHKF